MFILRKMRIQGECDYVEDMISIDYRKEFFSTLCHEILHYIHTDWTEQQVLHEEHKIMNAISIRQMKTFIKKFADIL
jgi:hypothetical protein